MSSKSEHIRARHGYTHVHVTVTQEPSVMRPAGRDAGDGEVSFDFSIPHGPDTVPVLAPQGDVVPSRLLDELLGCAADTPSETIDRLLASHDVHAARLGRALRAVQRACGIESSAPTPTAPSRPASCDGAVIDPVTHDPAW
ncbi:hypothetical protein AB0F18_33840 [Streptomyces sp. NPDC029216]|uniref:hypothetical protein n=1 Tax=Streptomyces sp. NPDC029216 TaxID=3154701 RepID=UPI0033C5277C